MKKAALLILFCIVSLMTNAQSNIRVNNYWENTYYINPASIDEMYMSVLTTTARKQWFRFPGAPSTFFATGTLFIDRMNTQFGLKAVVDKIGYTSTSNLALSYAYALTVHRNWRLYLGVALSFQSLSYDVSQANMNVVYDPAVYEHLTRLNNYNADVGVELVINSLKIGASGQNIFSVFTSENGQQQNVNFIYAKYRSTSREFFNLGYGVCGIQNGRLYQLEFNATSYFKLSSEADLFQAGVFYRTRSELGTLLGVNLSPAIQLFYSYDFNVSGISRSSVGTHELMLIFKLNKNSECIPCRDR